MSSMVTSSTVVIVSSMITAGSATVLSLVAVALLGCLLVGREIIHFGQGAGLRRLARGIDIAALPLILAFGLILLLRASQSYG
ncbi:MAG TPA: hypothetical protein VG370_23675 [Chloroflexota bacterium]|jgi:hypothetical protein|nr:hypothetical protein [Chloroflexota bacterium]